MKRITCEASPEQLRSEFLKNINYCNDETVEKFVSYYQLLLEWNERINLTAITDPKGVAERHFADSLLAASLIPQGAKVIDVGTGAGFPGIPLKLVRPDIELTLIDSLNKRIVFLNFVLKELGIEADTFHMRAEDGARNVKLRECFDIAVSRAVASMERITEWTLPFVKKGGASLLYKGPNADDELSETSSMLKKMHINASVKRYNCTWGERCIVILNK